MIYHYLFEKVVTKESDWLSLKIKEIYGLYENWMLY